MVETFTREVAAIISDVQPGVEFEKTFSQRAVDPNRLVACKQPWFTA
jgi:hypothetical protein